MTTKRVVVKDITKGLENQEIRCVNDFDSKIPDKFIYSTNYVAKDVSIIKVAAKGCHCTNCDERCPCLKQSTHMNTIINKECSHNCKCQAICCNNRKYMKNVRPKLEIYRTLNKGWAIRTLEFVERGEFIGEYIGEIFTDDFRLQNNRRDEYMLTSFVVPNDLKINKYGRRKFDYIVFDDKKYDINLNDLTDKTEKLINRDVIYGKRKHGLLSKNITAEFVGNFKKPFEKFSSDLDQNSTRSVTIDDNEKTLKAIQYRLLTPRNLLESESYHKIKEVLYKLKSLNEDECLEMEKKIFSLKIGGQLRNQARLIKPTRDLDNNFDIAIINPEVINTDPIFIDSAIIGNFTRFLNHSCVNNLDQEHVDRNEFVVATIGDNSKVALPFRRTVLVANSDILPYAELTWNYGDKYFANSNMKCKCDEMVCENYKSNNL